MKSRQNKMRCRDPLIDMLVLRGALILRQDVHRTATTRPVWRSIGWTLTGSSPADTNIESTDRRSCFRRIDMPRRQSIIKVRCNAATAAAHPIKIASEPSEISTSSPSATPSHPPAPTTQHLNQLSSPPHPPTLPHQQTCNSPSSHSSASALLPSLHQTQSPTQRPSRRPSSSATAAIRSAARRTATPNALHAIRAKSAHRTSHRSTTLARRTTRVVCWLTSSSATS